MWGDDLIVSQNILIGCTHENARLSFLRLINSVTGFKLFSFLRSQNARSIWKKCRYNTKSLYIQLNMSPCGWGLTHPQAILSVYDFCLSDEYNRSYIGKCPGSSKLNDGSEWVLIFNSPINRKKSIHLKIHPSRWLQGFNKGLLKFQCSFIRTYLH